MKDNRKGCEEDVYNEDKIRIENEGQQEENISDMLYRNQHFLVPNYFPRRFLDSSHFPGKHVSLFQN